MPIVTYIAPVGSDGYEMIRWSGNRVNTFVTQIPQRCEKYLTSSDLPAILIEGGWPYRSEILHGESMIAGHLANVTHRFTHEESEHRLSKLPQNQEFS